MSAPVAVVGRMVGYSSEGVFSHAFKREHGLPPRDVGRDSRGVPNPAQH